MKSQFLCRIFCDKIENRNVYPEKTAKKHWKKWNIVEKRNA